MAAARCANGLASIAREFYANGVGAVRAAAVLPAQFDHAHELFGRIDDLDSPLVEAAWARRLIQFKAKPGEEPAEHLERHDAGVVAGQVNPLPDILIRVAIKEADLSKGFQHVDGSGKPVNADRQGSVGVPEFTDSPVRRGESCRRWRAVSHWPPPTAASTAAAPHSSTARPWHLRRPGRCGTALSTYSGRVPCDGRALRDPQRCWWAPSEGG